MSAEITPFHNSERHKISHSDIKAIHKCEFNWYYSRYLNLMPVGGWPIVMEVGTFGHSLMEAGFTAIMNGGTYEDAAAASGQLLLTPDLPMEYTKVYKNCLAFFHYFLEQPWEIVALEAKSSVPVNEKYEFGFTPDILFRFTAGPYKGQLVLGDFKFTGQYWTDREINMHQQVPKYIIYKNQKDNLNIRRGLIIMLNTRANAKGTDLFTVRWVPVTKTRLENLERENLHMMERIWRYKEYGDEYGHEELKKILMHTGDEKTCKMCIFADDICPMEFDGKDITRTLKANYKKNDTYGYNGETDAKEAPPSDSV